jgi:hypothetical protein
METKIAIIARSYSQELFYLKKFKNEKEAINHGQRIVYQNKGCVITYFEEESTGHRWEVNVIENVKEGLNISTLVVNSKKNAKLVVEALKEYDDTLKIKYCKIY